MKKIIDTELLMWYDINKIGRGHRAEPVALNNATRNLNHEDYHTNQQWRDPAKGTRLQTIPQTCIK